MILDSNAVIIHGERHLQAALVYKAGNLTLYLGEYALENDPSLNQHWMISENSFEKSGNTFGFDSTGDGSYEITNFDLEFRVKFSLIKEAVPEETELTSFISYRALEWEMICITADEQTILHQNHSTEKIFRQLDRMLSLSDRYLKSCFVCALSGYEKGGATLYCMKKDKGHYLSKPYAEQYNSHYNGLQKERTAEFYCCDQFEFDRLRSKR